MPMQIVNTGSYVGWLPYKEGNTAFLPIWLPIWILIILIGLGQILWYWASCEIWRVGNGEWQISYPILGIGKTRVYALPLIRDFKAHQFYFNPSYAGLSIGAISRCWTGRVKTGALSFSYQNHTVYCGAELDDDTAQMLYYELAELGIKAA